MNNKISACIIFRDDPHIEKCLQSIRPYVDEIVAVSTSTADLDGHEIAKKYADIFEVFTECNDPETGMIEDFSLARQRSFDLATSDIALWQDSDDELSGGQHLRQIVSDYLVQYRDTPGAVLFPYEYAYDQNKKCILRHYRERLIFNKDKFHWVNPVHEVLTANTNVPAAMITREEVVLKHQRQFNPKVQEPGRNLRILKKYYEKVGDSDIRQLYYLGLECCNAGLTDEAIKHLEKYVSSSGWPDEIVMACLKLVEIHQTKNNLDKALKWAYKCIDVIEDWAECYFAVGKIYYFMAEKGGINEHKYWKKCIHFLKLGLTFPPTQTLLFINPMERDVQVYEFLNLAQNKLGQVDEALKSAETGLLKDPNNIHLKNNIVLYKEFLARKVIVENLNILKNNKSLDQTTVENVSALINNKPILNSNIADWQIPENYDVNSLPEPISDNKLKNMVLFLWKQYMLYDDAAAAINFLKEAPPGIRGAPEILQALELTQNFLNQSKIEKIIKTEGKLDICFFIGEGWEIWNGNSNNLGGSESMAIFLARELAKLGHKVKIYNSCGDTEGVYDGVQYLKSEKCHDLECDVLIVSRRADYLDDKYNITAKLKLLWLHDVYSINATSKLLMNADRILCLSQWHKDFAGNHHKVHQDQVIVSRNGIDLNRFKKEVKRNQYKCFNSSSPDRSWPILLTVWPKIKERVPQAELHLFYSFFNWKKIAIAAEDQNQLNLIASLEKQIKEMSSLDVYYHGRVDQEVLAEEMLSSGVWLYPTWFSETSCLSAMESQAAGCRIITSNIAALKETVGSRGILLEGEWTSPEYQEKFIENSVKALLNNDDADRIELQKYAQEKFSLDTLAQDWEKMFFNLIEGLKINPLVPYKDLNAA